MVKIFKFAFIALVASTAVALPEDAGGGNSECAQWCAANFVHPGNDCTSLATKGIGPCYECGPKKTKKSMQCCNEKCCDTDSDNDNCGWCGNKCTFPEKCCSGNKKNCWTDHDNCGDCGKKCNDDEECEKGKCYKKK